MRVYLDHPRQASQLGSHYAEDEALQGLGYECCEPAEEIPFEFREGGYCVDDVRRGTLPMDLVREARRQEIQGFRQRRVYEVRPRYEAEAAGGKIVGVRWVDTAKAWGVRSRLVCQDFNRDSKRSDDMFAPTPPLTKPPK